MSRIGKGKIDIPEKTEVILLADTVVVKGPLGELSHKVHSDIGIEIASGSVTFVPKVNTLEANALWGTTSSHLSNMIDGVNKPFEKKLVLEGIGYKVEVKGDKIHLALGFSHPVEVLIPKGLNVKVEKNAVTISGISKDDVGSFTARLRDLKKPEPYKGKGFKYFGEVIKIKQGKKSV
jgi:large subunit ribosomal protein L6